MGLKFELIFSIQFNIPESMFRENNFEKLFEKNIFFLNKTISEVSKKFVSCWIKVFWVGVNQINSPLFIFIFTISPAVFENKTEFGVTIIESFLFVFINVGGVSNFHICFPSVVEKQLIILLLSTAIFCPYW